MLFSRGPGADPTDGSAQLDMHNEWFAGFRESVKYLEARWTAEIGRPLPELPYGYRPLLRYVLSRRWTEDAIQAPFWYRYNRYGTLPLSLAGARLLDGFYGLVAAAMEREVASPWEVRCSESTSTVWPLMRGTFLTPTGSLAAAVRVLLEQGSAAGLDGLGISYARHRGVDYQDDLFAGRYFAVDDDLNAIPAADWLVEVPPGMASWPTEKITLVTYADLVAQAPTPNVTDFVVRVIVPGEDPEWDEILADEFTHIVEVDKQLDDFIGDDARAELEDTLLAEDGVVATSGEDREWLYLNAPGLTADEVMDLVRRVVTRLASDYEKR